MTAIIGQLRRGRIIRLLRKGYPIFNMMLRSWQSLDLWAGGAGDFSSGGGGRTDIDHSGNRSVCNYAGRHDFICNGLSVGLDSAPAEAGLTPITEAAAASEGVGRAIVSRSTVDREPNWRKSVVEGRGYPDPSPTDLGCEAVWNWSGLVAAVAGFWEIAGHRSHPESSRVGCSGSVTPDGFTPRNFHRTVQDSPTHANTLTCRLRPEF